MKTVIALALFGLLALAAADYNGYGYGNYGYGGVYGGPYDHYGHGLSRGPHGVYAPYRNDLRQKAVNHKAVAIGASDGTAGNDGVPGTPSGVFHHAFRGHFNNGY